MSSAPAVLTKPAAVPRRLREWDDEVLVLGIETSCDETSAAVVRGGRDILSNVVASSAELHAEYGGIVPEIAARAHVETLSLILAEALRSAECTFWDLDAVAVTRGPGLAGSLLIGVAEAKAIAAVLQVPLVGVNHLEAHLYANLLADPAADFPALALIISGGHTLIVHARAEGEIEVLGSTVDDAAGEAFDKVARFLGLEYPGGPAIDRLALLGDPGAVTFPRSMAKEAGFDVSYSGLKTAVVNHVRRAEARGETVVVADVAASFQAAVVDIEVAKTMAAARHVGADRVFLSGGVAANSALRAGFAAACAAEGRTLNVPPSELCTDNAAMVAACGTSLLRRGLLSDLDAAPDPNLPLAGGPQAV